MAQALAQQLARLTVSSKQVRRIGALYTRDIIKSRKLDHRGFDECTWAIACLSLTPTSSNFP